MDYDFRREPQIIVKSCALYSPEDIDAFIKRYREDVEAVFGHRSTKQLQFYESERQRLNQLLGAEARRVKRLQDKNGWTAMQARYDAANDVLNASLTAVERTKPTTAAGISALAAYAAEICDDQLEGDREDRAKSFWPQLRKRHSGSQQKT